MDKASIYQKVDCATIAYCRSIDKVIKQASKLRLISPKPPSQHCDISIEEKKVNQYYRLVKIG